MDFNFAPTRGHGFSFHARQRTELEKNSRHCGSAAAPPSAGHTCLTTDGHGNSLYRMDELVEVFSQARIEKALAVATAIINNWRKSKLFDCRVLVDERLDNKSFAELATMYFSIGLGDDLTDLPFLKLPCLREAMTGLFEGTTQSGHFRSV